MTTPDAALLKGLHIVMVKTRFPENIGMAARAAANMGAAGIVLVAPERWDMEKARPLATPKGEALLRAVRVVPDLAAALAPYTLVVGTTARTGGWRRQILVPEQAAAETVQALCEGGDTALVFGPEDRGLNNEEIEQCQRLVTIPTVPEASSLNVAQSILLLLYECRKTATRAAQGACLPTAPATVLADAREAADDAHGQEGGRRVTAAEQQRLFAALKESLLAIDYLHGDNPDYFLMPVRRFLGRTGLRRHEYDALMGVCRQIKNKIG